MTRKTFAERLAAKQREISVSEFFERNKHILGFDSPTKALLTSVKEAMDNALDACQEYGVLPDLLVRIDRVDRDEFRLVVEDNGPGIVKGQLPKVFGKLLYGSRFHAWSQTRGQQGLGISGVILYGQITTGKPAVLRSKTAQDDVAYQIELLIDTKRNRPQVLKRDFKAWERDHGTRVEVHLRGRFVNGRQSVMEYLRATAIVNPYARIVFQPPDGPRRSFERVSSELPPPPVEVKPHPYGVELGTLLQMAKESPHRRFPAFLQSDFSRISSRVAKEICREAEIPPDLRPKDLRLPRAKRVHAAFRRVKIMAPPTDCLSPIGERLIRTGLRNVVGTLRPEFYAPPITRPPTVYGGHPFQVEVGIVYGGDLPSEQPVEILRYANRAPLLYQQGACATTQAIESVDWRRYGLEQRGGRGMPYGPAMILVHVCATRVPFTSEAKEAIAPIPEIVAEVVRALQESGRRLRSHMSKKARRTKTKEKFEIVRAVLPLMAEKSAGIVGQPTPDITRTIAKIMNVIWIDEQVEYRAHRHSVRIEVYNYTGARKRLTLHAALPPEALDPTTMAPSPARLSPEGKASWELPWIRPTERVVVAFQLEGLRRVGYEGGELYVSGAPTSQVVGADPLPGDWDLQATGMPEEGPMTEESLPAEEVAESG
ncbi:MAG: DNA topoisomerase VI subunit B [Thermoplasmata archaeon]